MRTSAGMSAAAMVRASASGGAPDRMWMAVAGPTFFTVMSRSNS
jgi:hypothetical protein